MRLAVARRNREMTVLGQRGYGVEYAARHRTGSRSRTTSDELVADGDRRCLCPVGDAQLGQEVGDVVLHRAPAEKECGRDLAVGPPRDEQAEHLDLAFGEGGAALRRELPRWGATQRTRRRDRQGEGHRVLEAEVVPGGL